VAAGAVCADPTPCREAGTCNGAGACGAGAPANEGRPCIGANFCQDTQCRAGACTITGTRDCSMGDPCRRPDACQPDVGCLVVNICDMLPPPDLLMSTPDLAGADLAGADLSMTPPDLTGADLTGADLSAPPEDQSASAPDMGAQADGGVPVPDGGPADQDLGHGTGDGPAGTGEPGFRLPFSLVGGACQCNLGRGEAPAPLGLMLLAALWAFRRRRR
jgi:MYXO-CTERM domain-containing protein